jgi:hypothetical protein
MGVHNTPSHYLTTTVIEWAFLLPLGESMSSSSWDVLGDIQATQVMSDSKVLLVAVLGHETNSSLRTIWNLADSVGILITMVVTLMGVPLGCCLVHSIILTNITLPALELMLSFITLLPVLCLECPVTIQLST